MNLFEPVPASGKTIAATTSSSAVLLNSNLDGQFQVAVYNPSSTDIALVDFGGSGVTVTNTNGHVVPPGAIRGFTIKNSSRDKPVYMAAIMASGTGATLYFSVGHGI